MINSIFSAYNTYAPTNKQKTKNDNKELEKKENIKNSDKADKTNKTDNYDKYDKLSKYERKTEISNMISQAERQTRNFEKLITSVFKKQSNKAGLVNMAYNGNLKNFYKNLVVDAKTIEQAKKDISEDGYYGVKQTSDRILSFAKAVAGNNPKKIEEMRKAVEKGFKEAERMWGGKLPEISQKTYDKVMETFDSWQGKNTNTSEQVQPR